MKPRRVGVGLTVTLVTLYLSLIHYTDINQVALVWNRFDGNIQIDSVPGFNITAPWVKVARIETRPQRVCVTSASRSFNCKLVRFNPAGFKELIQVEGIHYYWLYNRISFNGSYGEEYRGVRDLLRGYAYSSKRYSFISIVEETGDP